jgi:hypothetical protein
MSAASREADEFVAHFATQPRVAARVGEVDFSSGCWQMPTSRYARLSGGRRGSYVYLHRLSLELKLGRPLGSDHALHSCDNPPCVNPAHLRSGNAKENGRDMVERGRARNKVVRGVENCKATLTDQEIVAALRRVDAGETMTVVARDCGVTRRAVQTWHEGLRRREAYLMWLSGDAA